MNDYEAQQTLRQAGDLLRDVIAHISEIGYWQEAQDAESLWEVLSQPLELAIKDGLGGYDDAV